MDEIQRPTQEPMMEEPVEEPEPVYKGTDKLKQQKEAQNGT